MEGVSRRTSALRFRESVGPGVFGVRVQTTTRCTASSDGVGPPTVEGGGLRDPLEDLPKGRVSGCWRPTTDDVDRISWGRPAKQKSTGSRGVPHRLNEEERRLYDLGRRKGFVELGGSGWREQRRGAPLVNTFRNWCDARAVPMVAVFKASDGCDRVMCDLSPLRLPAQFHALGVRVAAAAPGGSLDVSVDEEGEEWEGVETALDEEAFASQPIHRLPMYSVSWDLERPEAKALAGRLAEAFACREAVKGAKRSGGRSLERGMPGVKPGKGRRHGGYGI